MEAPLVSCLMPTADRREVMTRALRCFHSQDYPNLELIILDDGADPVNDLIVKADDTRIRYYREFPKKCHGDKMNRCMEIARGEFAIVFDDDDVYSPDRVTRQIAPFLSDPELEVTGTSTLYYYEHGTEKAWQYTSGE